MRAILRLLTAMLCVVAIVPLVSAADHTEDNGNPKVLVRLLNHAKLDEGYLSLLRDRISKDYRPAKIDIVWYVPTAPTEQPPRGVRYIYLVDHPVKCSSLEEDHGSLGCVMSIPGTIGYVDMKRAMEIESESHLAYWFVAPVIDHELMHLLGGVHTSCADPWECHMIMAHDRPVRPTTMGWDLKQTDQIRQQLLAAGQVASR